VISGRTELLPAQSIFYVAFVDPSGGRRDQFTVAVAHRCGDKAIIDMIRAWKPPFDPSEVVKECAETLRPYRIRTIVGDAYGGEWPREQFRKHNIQYTVSALNRSQLYLNLIPTINSKRCELPADRRMIEELRRLGRRRGRTGKDSIDHPAHLSDDLANSKGRSDRPGYHEGADEQECGSARIGRGLGAELRQAFGPLAMDKPFPDSTFGPAPAEERPNTGCAILHRSPFSYGADDGGEEAGDYVSQTGRRRKFPSRDRL
jgi:hypothetical protein